MSKNQHRGDYVTKQARQDRRSDIRQALSEAADTGHRALAAGETERAAAIAVEVLLPQVDASAATVWELDSAAADVDGLTIDRAVLKLGLRRVPEGGLPAASPGVDGPKWWLQLPANRQAALFRSAYAALVLEGTLDGDATTAVPAWEYDHQVGERYYSPTSSGTNDLEMIDPEGDLKATLFTGDQGSGKTTARKTVTEDRRARGHKVVDLIDNLKVENGTYDIEAQADWQVEGREQMDLATGFGDDYDPGRMEIRVPLTPELTEQSVPYHTEREEWVVKPFVIPASELTYRQLVMVLPHVTKTHENHLQAAYQQLSQARDDYTLADIATVVREDTNAGDTVADRIERSLQTAQEKGFIQDRQVDDEYILDWHDVMADADTITAFSASTLAEKSDRLLLASYLLDSLYQARRQLIVRKQLHAYPTLTVGIGELHEIAPRSKSEQDAEATIESYMIDTLAELIALVRHADIELLCDTQKFHRQLSPEVSGLFHRVFAFGGHKPDIKKIFSTRVGSSEARQHAPKVTNYDDGRCALVSGDGFSMPIQFAPPRAHHLDAKTDGNGLGFRTRHLEDEALREAPWNATIPARLQFDDTPDSPVIRFWEAHVEESDDPEAVLLKEDVTEAYHKWSDLQDETKKAHKQLHAYISKHIGPDAGRTIRHDRGDKQRPCYKGLRLTF
jgi:hypothetical protein